LTSWHKSDIIKSWGKTCLGKHFKRRNGKVAKEMIAVTTINGTRIEVDKSDEACSKFGFRHDQKVSVLNQFNATVIGVAPGYEGYDPEPDVLWYIRDDLLQAKYCYPLNPGDLRLLDKKS
jgi:hypothetical protein